MPFLAGEPITIGDRTLIDSGVSEGVPVRTALEQGATHIVALRTRRLDEPSSAPSRGERLLLSRWFARYAPGAVDPWLRRAEIRAEEERLLGADPAVVSIRPPLGSPSVGRTERRAQILRGVVDTGRQVAMEALAACVDEPV
jgi:predicted patatin/cPLA2 family phospholipase